MSGSKEKRGACESLDKFWIFLEIFPHLALMRFSAQIKTQQTRQFIDDRQSIQAKSERI